METPRQDQSTLQALGLMVLAVIAGGVFWYQSPLTSSRPPASPAQKFLIQEKEDVLARLWEDPLAAVARFREKERPDSFKQSSNSLDHVVDQIHELANPTVEIFMVMVDGSPYAEGREVRLRSRYATLSGLSVAGYVPTDSEHLGYFEFSSQTIKSGVIPYEWFRPNRLNPPQQPKPVLVLWLNDQHFSAQPLVHLAELMGIVKTQVASQCALSMPDQKTCNLQFRLLGPTGSTTLAEMVRETHERRDTPDQAALQDSHVTALQELVIYSPWATAANALLIPDPPTGPIISREITPPHTRIKHLFQSLGITLHRTIHSDAYLVEALLDELGRRGVDVQSHGPTLPTDHVVIIAEWDTFYARALPLTFAASVALPKSEESPLQFERMLRTLQAGDPTDWPSWVHRFSYLRGLDGEVPTDRKNKPTPQRTRRKDVSPEPRLALTDMERAQGTSQFDYLRSLATSITNLQEDLKRQCWEEKTRQTPCPSVKAIGVLGSDVYDKLLVLQALRQNFPNALFFTTDLDARLFYPEDFRWTRNVIIASSFGLSLHPHIQADIPPFRDNYQTAQFYSGLRALDYSFSKEINNALSPNCVPPCPSPRIFEIGRRGAYDLTPDSDPLALHPPRQHLFPGSERWTYGILLPIFLLAMLLLWLFRFTWNQSATKDRGGALSTKARLYVSWGFFASIIFIAFVLWWDWVPRNLAGEPFTFVDGISIWPTELLRLVVVLLCLYALGYSRDALIQNADTINQRFMFTETMGTPFNLRLFSKSFASSLLTSFTLRPWQFPKGQSIATIWSHYQQLDSPASRAGRCIVPVIVFYLFGMVLTSFLGRPHLPYRGEFSKTIDLCILFVASIPLLLYLTFWIGDATMLCRRFIHQLIDQPTFWPEDSGPQADTSTIVEREVHRDWLTIRIIAQRTSVVGQFLLYPFFAVLVMIGSRSSYFDHWDFPTGLVLIFAFLLCYVLFCAIALRRSAHKIKIEILHRLRQKLLDLIGGGKEKETQIEQLRMVIDEIQSLREGAFVPLAQHPIFRAIFAFGGLSVFTLAEYFGTLY